MSPNGALTLLVLSPAPLSLPADLTVQINSVPVTYTWVAANGDTTGREWTLTLPHADFTPGDYSVTAAAQGGGTSAHVFTVDAGGAHVALRNLLAFPNPFDEKHGTNFSFRLAHQR